MGFAPMEPKRKRRASQVPHVVMNAADVAHIRAKAHVRDMKDHERAGRNYHQLVFERYHVEMAKIRRGGGDPTERVIRTLPNGVDYELRRGSGGGSMSKLEWVSYAEDDWRAPLIPFVVCATREKWSIVFSPDHGKVIDESFMATGIEENKAAAEARLGEIIRDLFRFAFPAIDAKPYLDSMRKSERPFEVSPRTLQRCPKCGYTKGVTYVPTPRRNPRTGGPWASSRERT